MRSDCQTRCTPLLGSCSCPLHAGCNVRLHPDNTRNTIANCLYPESPIPLSKTAIESVGRKRRYVRGSREMGLRRSRLRIRIREQETFPIILVFPIEPRLMDLFVFVLFFRFFLTLYRSIKKPIGSVQNKRGKQNLSKQFDNRGAGEGRLSSNRYQNFLLTWNLTWNLRLYTCPLTANFFSQK